MFFDKILDYMNLDNWANGKYINNSQSHSSTDKEQLYLIKSFYENNTCNYMSRPYRAPHFSEKAEFAKVDILSYFTNARQIDNFSSTLLEQLGITNWHQYISSLQKSGYIRAANHIEILNTFTLPDLKTLADSLGIKKNGKKAELAQRIYDNLPPEELQDINIIYTESDLYILTEKGREFLNYQEDYVLLSKNRKYNVSLSEFNDHRILAGRKRNFYDTMFQVFCDRIFYYQSHNCYEACAMEHLHIFEIMMAEHKCTTRNIPLDIALSHYVEYLYLMTCFPRYARWCVDGIHPSNLTNVSLPRISTNIYKLQEYRYLINFEAIWKMNPPSFLTRDEFTQYINEIFDSPMFDYQKWDLKISNRIMHYFKLN